MDQRRERHPGDHRRSKVLRGSRSTRETEDRTGETGGLSVEYIAGREAGQFKKELTVHTMTRPVPCPAESLGKVIQRLVWKPVQLKLFLNKENLGLRDLVITAVAASRFPLTGISARRTVSPSSMIEHQATEICAQAQGPQGEAPGLAYPKRDPALG